MRTSDQIIFVHVLVYCSRLSRRAQQGRGQLRMPLLVCYVCMRMPYVTLGTFGACGKKQDGNNNNK